MTGNDVVQIVHLLEEAGVCVCVDGGWGVDALLGSQTRPHNDLDIAVRHDDLNMIRKILDGLGYQELPHDDPDDPTVVLTDNMGRSVDVHPYTFDDNGRFVKGIPYPIESLAGTGTIENQSVRCITPEWAIRFHTQFEPDETDFHDVRALCERFTIPLPKIYDRFLGAPIQEPE